MAAAFLYNLTGEEEWEKIFAEAYKEAGITKVVTIEASGIAPALEASNDAKTYNIIATVLLVLNCIGSVVYYVVFGFAQISQAIANM